MRVLIEPLCIKKRKTKCEYEKSQSLIRWLYFCLENYVITCNTRVEYCKMKWDLINYLVSLGYLCILGVSLPC